MKQLKSYAIVVGLAFVLGLSLASIYADEAAAGPGPPPIRCEPGCNMVICLGQGSCDYGYVERWRFWWDGPECIGLRCDSAFIGCGFPF